LSAEVQQRHSDVQAMLSEEIQKSKSLQMKLDAQESEIEYLTQKMTPNVADRPSSHNGGEPKLDDSLLGLVFSS